MLNEWQEFLDYTGPMTYKADREKDTTWLGRFTFEALRDFGGLSRILTILARGFLFLGSDGTALGGQPRERMAYARRGLCAWCSVPERAGAQPEWKDRTDFRSFHERGWPGMVLPTLPHRHGFRAGQSEDGAESVFRDRREVGQEI